MTPPKNIANNFSLRHHNSDQIQNYDQDIWYSWIFHFYLAKYHAVIRLIDFYSARIRDFSLQPSGILIFNS